MTAKKGTNGTKAADVVAVCPHHDLCQAPSRQAELMASVDEMAKGVGMMLERHEELGRQVIELTQHITRVSEESLARARIYIESNDQILKTLARLEGKA